MTKTRILWDDDKDRLLRKERGFSFHDVIAAVESGKIVDNIMHHNQTKYPGQRVMIVDINDYIYAVPYVKDINDNIFLKTIIPSRKLTKRYRKR